MTSTNPLLETWTENFGTPPWSRIKPEHVKSAYEVAMKDHKQAIAAIAANPATATFENTIVPLETAGKLFSQVSYAFHVLAGTMASDEIMAIDEEMTPILSRHGSEIRQNPLIFSRVSTIYNNRAALPSLEQRLVEDYYKSYMRAGAALPDDKKQEYANLSARAASLNTEFEQRLTKEMKDKPIIIETAAQLDGVPAQTMEKAAAKAAELGKPGQYAFTNIRPVVDEILTHCTVRDTRKAVHHAFIMRGDVGDEYDTKNIPPELMQIRQKQAELLGFKTYAHYAVAENMAKTPEAALGLMRDLWEPAKAAFIRERAAVQAEAAKHGQTEPVESWDWHFYSEKLRASKYDLNDAELKPYLKIENVQELAFATAKTLFGITFTPAPQVEVWHPDVKAYEITDASGAHLGVFYGDYFARDGKRSGAWMSEIRGQNGLGATDERPHIYNVCNFTKPQAGEPALLSIDDATTLMHELGHGLHGLLSRVKYPSFSGVNVPMDFVEFPSQFYEHFLTHPQVMKQYLRHEKTGEPISDALIEKVQQSKTFNQGYELTRYLASAILDLELHLQPNHSQLDIAKYEAEGLKKLGMPDGIGMMHRMPHFQHIFTGPDYAAQYYVYYWAAVLEHDGFEVFQKNPANPDHVSGLKSLYASGNSRDTMEQYESFRKQKPSREPMLRNLGLVAS